MGIVYHYLAAARARKCRLAGKAGCDRRACTVTGDSFGMLRSVVRRGGMPPSRVAMGGPGTDELAVETARLETAVCLRDLIEGDRCGGCCGQRLRGAMTPRRTRTQATTLTAEAARR
jgi:hypothetical protein